MNEKKAATADTATEPVSVRLKRCIDICDLILRGPASKHYRWLMDLSQELDNTITTPFNLTFSYSSPTSRGCHSALYCSTVQLLTLLRDCMLHLRYQEASEYLRKIVDCCRSRMPLFVEPALRKCGLEIMYSIHEYMNQAIEEEFVNQCKSLHPLISPQMVIIDHFLHLLTSTGLAEASESISTLPKDTPNIPQSPKTVSAKLMFRAYRGFASYLEWEKHMLQHGDTEADFSQSLRLGSLAEKALDDLCCVNDEPGVWDVFLVCQVKLLVYLGRTDEAFKVLKHYKAKCSNNPNSYLCIIDLINLHCPTKITTRQETLKQYCMKWPSDKQRALEYVSTLTTDEPEQLQAVIQIYFSLLDYNIHREDTDLWTRFNSLLGLVVESSDVSIRKFLSGQWITRKSWWTPYHFSFPPAAIQSGSHSTLRSIKLQSLDKLRLFELNK